MAKGRESKPHIGIFGRRNNGKSSLINALSGQDIAIVSGIPGTTTDPVKKSIEIFGIGPSIIVDTAGMDDSGELGLKRVGRSLAALKTVDLAILVITGNLFGKEEEKIISVFQKQEVPYIIIHNKSDQQPLDPALKNSLEKKYGVEVIQFCALSPTNQEEVVDAIKRAMPETAYVSDSMLGDILGRDEVVVLVTPIDNEAPEVRLILPQVQAIRDIIDNDAVAVVLKETELEKLITVLRPRPVLVVTDSQMFKKVDKLVPADIPLTGFSVMLARHKGDFEQYLKGTPKIDELSDGDRVLLLESCTHQVACDDIGRFKIPAWIREHTGKNPEFDIVAGLSDLPRPVSDYSLIIQCGGCMITRRQLMGRIRPAIEAGVPVTNYGMAIAWLHGIYDRAIEPFTGSRKTSRTQ